MDNLRKTKANSRKISKKESTRWRTTSGKAYANQSKTKQKPGARRTCMRHEVRMHMGAHPARTPKKSQGKPKESNGKPKENQSKTKENQQKRECPLTKNFTGRENMWNQRKNKGTHLLHRTSIGPATGFQVWGGVRVRGAQSALIWF